MRLECWSCSPVRRKGCGRDRTTQNQPAHDCGHPYCSLLTPDTAGWGENSDSGQGTFSQPTGKGTNRSLEDCETDPDDTSAFDYSSVTSCSPDGTLRGEMMGSGEDEEEDSQVPVLLKPSYSQQQQSREAPRERTVCLRWQIPRLTPHPPLRNTAGPGIDGPTPCLVSSYGKRLVSVRKGSPPLHPKSAFRPIWDDPSKQVFSCLLHKCCGLSILSYYNISILTPRRQTSRFVILKPEESETSTLAPPNSKRIQENVDGSFHWDCLVFFYTCTKHVQNI